MNLNKQKAFIIHVAYFTLILVLVYVAIKYLLPLLMPFVIGIVIAVFFRRLIDTIEKKTHIKRSIVSIVILLIFYCVVGFIISLIGVKVFNSIGDLFNNLPSIYENFIEPALSKIEEDLVTQFPGIKDYMNDFMENISDSLFGFISNASQTVLGKIANLAGQVPSLLIKFIFTIVSSFFFTIDYHRITRFIVLQFKGNQREMLLKLKDNGLGTLGKFFKAYATIISITFVELSIGFWIIGIPNPIFFGGLIAIIDVMPILGTGAVLLPWSIISFILGNTRVGIGMLLLYIIITVVRQTIEPKIVGQQIGLHPLVTLILMFIGAQLMGVLGLLLLPIIATIVMKLNKEGTIRLFKET